MAPPDIRVGAVQHPPVYQDRDATVDRAVKLIREAGENGADVIAFPEGFVSGYPAYFSGPMHPTSGERAAFHTRVQDNALRIPSAATDRLGEAAADADAYVVMGCNELDDRRGGRSLYNSQVLFDPRGDIVLARRKLMPTLSERVFHGWGDGADLDVVETPFGKLGALICWEHHMPLVRAAMIERGEHVHVAGWPGNYAYDGDPGSGDACDFIPAVREYAFAAGTFVISANAILGADDLPADLGDVVETASMARGGSSIVGPTGQFLVEPVYDEHTILYADCDMATRHAAKSAFDPVGHYARDDVTSLSVRRPSRKPAPAPTPESDRLESLAAEFDIDVETVQGLAAALQEDGQPAQSDD